jgi:hypothetical protein
MRGERRRGLTPRATLLLATLALGVAFTAASISSAERKPQRTPAMLSAPRGPAVDLRLAAATVPKLREAPAPRERKVRRAARPAPRVARVETPQPAPPTAIREETPQPTPNPTPRQVAPPPRRSVPPPETTPEPRAPVSTPVATPEEPSGEFDTTGEEP